MKILVINCGSSSLKYQVIDMEGELLLAKGLVERISMEGSIITHEKRCMDKWVNETPMENHDDAIEQILNAILDPEHGALKSLDELGAVGHRVVHRAEKFASSVLINSSVMEALEECADLAPLHNPPNIYGIMACQKLMPNTPMQGKYFEADGSRNFWAGFVCRRPRILCPPHLISADTCDKIIRLCNQ